MPMTDPRQAYTALLSERRADILFRERRQASLAYGRLGAVVGAPRPPWLPVGSHALVLPLAASAGLVLNPDRVPRRLAGVARPVRYFEKAPARLDGTWEGTGES